MARIVQGTMSPGYGGLEMVVVDFHEWLLSQGHEAYVMVLQGAPLHQHLIEAGHTKTVLAIPDDANRVKAIKLLRKKLDGKETSFLFHRQSGLKTLPFSRLKAKISMLSHTFYGVKKRDPWHYYIFSKVDQWIALTASHRANLLETSGVDPKKVIVIPNGVDLKKYKPTLSRAGSPNMTHVGVVARLDRQKGQEIAIEALHILKTQGRNLKLHLFGEETPGETSIRPELEKRIVEFGLQEEVVFEGFKSDMHKYLPQMDIVWVPSYKETFGRCVIESMASGIPVIGSNAGGVPDIIDEGVNGLLFETKNAQDLAEKTEMLLADRALQEKIRVTALQDVQTKYNKDQIWPQLLDSILPEAAKIAERQRLTKVG